MVRKALPRLVLLFALLAASLTLKASLAADTQADTDARVAREIVAFLNRQNLTVGAMRVDADMTLIAAEGPACGLRVVLVSALGWHQEVVRSIAAPGDEVAFVFDGAAYASQPLWRTRLHHYGNQLRRYAGLRRQVRPVLGVLAERRCGLDTLPWREVATVPGGPEPAAPDTLRRRGSRRRRTKPLP